jgi:ATP-dependent DNA helicase PIF1
VLLLINANKCYCGGEGGTGKSQIINAFADFFDNNNTKNRLFIGAFTGTAAFNIRDKTLFKSLSMTRQKNPNNKNPNSRIMQSKWNDVDHLIINEVSFIGQWVLNIVHQSLMIVKNSNSNFGGINILFCGDFCQLPPVNEEALYKLTKMESQKSGFVCNVCKSCKTNYSNKYKKIPVNIQLKKNLILNFRNPLLE